MSCNYLFISAEEVHEFEPIHQLPTPTIIDAQVPGYIRMSQRTLGKGRMVAKVQKVLSEEARINSSAVAEWGLKLHRAGKSLNGKFEAADLKKDPSSNVKCVATKRVILKTATTKRKKDFKRIGKIIKNDILGVQSEADLPFDVKHLLDLLKSYAIGYEILIAHHPGLEDEDRKITLFDRLFHELESIMVTDPQKYNKIIAAMPYGNNYWRPFASCNKYVYGVYTFRKRMNSYADSSEGAIHLYRNCFQHLLKDHSRVIQGGVVVVLFVYKQMEHMMGTILPGVIVNMMVQMYNHSALTGVF